METLRIRPRASPETFLLESVGFLPGGGDRLKVSELHRWRIAKGVGGSREGPDAVLWFAVAAIHEKERANRDSITRKTAPGSRNIRLDVGPGVAESVYQLLCNAADTKELEVIFSDFKTRVADVLAPACEALGLRTADLSTCRVTDELIEATGNEVLSKALRYWLTQGDLSSAQVGELRAQLERDFPEETEAVIAALTATTAQGQLSAVSLDVQDEKVWVSLVNADGDHVKMEAYKFLGMLENPLDGRLLCRFHNKPWQSPSHPFVFKDYREGQVSGRFVPAQGRFDIAHVLEKGNRTNDRSQFFLEREYLACLFVVLGRLREDREQITRLLENAEATETFDPFEVIKDSND